MDVNENAEADVAFGDPVTATDPDSGTMLTYSLSGADAITFAIEPSTGQLKTKGPLDYEGPQNVYDVIVTASDGSLTASVDVSIAVNDVKEGPGTPDAPVVEAAATDGQTELDVTWTAPSNTGPTITDYDVQYRVAGSEDDFAEASHDGLATQATITELSPGVTYEVQVRATNDEDTGLWSMSGEGTTGSVTRAVDENTAADVAFGDPVTATDADSGSTLSYSLSGTDAASFAIVESSGQLKTKASLDYETKASYSVEVRADDGFVVKSIAVTINVNDVNEAPVFPDGAPSLDVNENTVTDVAFGDPVTAMDPDSGAMLTYSLSGTDAASFGIVESSGQLKTKGPLDYEGSQNVYDVIVTASDGSLTASVDVSIAVNDVKEAPGTPDAPTVMAAATDGQTELDVTWTAPSNTGPTITDYDVQYRVAGSEDDFAEASHDGLATQATITELSPGVTYEVQVRATNDEDTGLWSMSGEGTTGSVTRAVDENTAADVAFGDPVTATDADSGSTLSYSLSGTDAASFAIVESSGQLKTKAPLDYEMKTSYSVEVHADDGSVVESIAVTIAVNDVKEEPGTPDAPVVEAAATDGQTALDVTWTGPSNTGPAITDYDVQYRVADSGDDFTDASYDGVSVSTTITDLDSDTTYEVQVRATNDEETGSWSTSGEGTTGASPNNAPAFTEGATTTRAVDENAAADVAFGDPVAATDVDSDDTLSYSLSGTDAASFAVVDSSGQLKTKAALNYEAKASYSVTLTVRDGDGATDSIAVMVNVNDVEEAPGTPDAPMIEAASTDGHTALDVTWTAPSNTGPAITDYDVQYRVADSGDDFTDASSDGVVVNATITGLSPNTTHEVQVRATNAESTGLWSMSGEGTTGAAPNSAPAFTEGATATRAVDENTAADVAFGDPVAATDTDSDDTLSYSLAGTDAASFAIVSSSGQLKTKASLDYETKAIYSVEVRVDDGFVVKSIAVTINVNDVNEPPAFPEGSPTLAVDENTAARTLRSATQ